MDVSFQLTDDTKLMPNYDIARPYLSNIFSDVKPNTETTIINSTGADVIITDNYGMCSRISNTPLDSNLAVALGVHSGFKGVFIIEKKLVSNTDLYHTMVSNMDRPSTVGVRGLALEDYLRDMSNKVSRLYKIHKIPHLQLNMCRCIELNVLNYTVALPGYEKIHKNLQEENGEVGISRDHKYTISKSIAYYSAESSCVYINILNKIIRIDSQPIEDGLKGSGVKMIFEECEGRETTFIPEEDFPKYKIFLTRREAESNMDSKSLLEVKKLDVDYYQAETKLLCSMNDRAMLSVKGNIDMLTKQIQLNFEKFKIITASQKAGGDNIDKTKKIMDVISMIFKVIK